MNPKKFLGWLYQKIKNYNLFMIEIEDNERENFAILVQYQKYTTRLYILLLLVSLYILFYITLISPNLRTVTISKMTPMIFDELEKEHADSLSCPCSTTTIRYEKFISNQITYESVCSSIFVSEEWIEALYLTNASRYGITDFRTTAKAQFQLLSDFCSISKQIISQSLIEFNQNEFVNIELLTSKRIQSTINVTVNVLKESLSTQIISFLNYLRIYIRSNYLVSSLNTNLILSTILTNTQYNISQLQTQYTANITTGTTNADTMLCGTDNPILAVGFFMAPNTTGAYQRALFIQPRGNIRIVNGFFAGCTPLEGILSSTLDCLYDIQCIQLLMDYFPSLRQLEFNWNDSILSCRQENVTVYENVEKLFVNEWLTEMNYSKYYSSCSPSSCSYRTTDPINWTYGITVFISLYGGLTIILRLIAPLLINLLFQYKNVRRLNLVELIKRMNIFENPDERSEEDIREQKMSTRLYILLLIGSLMVLLLFSLLANTLSTSTISNPSLMTYKTFQLLYPKTLHCPCSNPIPSYNSLISISPVLHQVCSSDFVTTRWLSIVENIYDYMGEDWRNRAFAQFHLLARLCELANNTINDGIRQFLLQPFVVSNLLSEFEYSTQINTTLNQFFQSTVNSFVSLIEIGHVLTQVDQLYMGSVMSLWTTKQDQNIISTISSNNNLTNIQSLQTVFQLAGTLYVNLSSMNCICGLNASCQSSVGIYQMDYVWNSRIRAYIDYIVPGSIAGCSNFDSLLFSELLCFYSSSDCFSILLKYMKDSYYYNVEYPTWFDPSPLVYDERLSRYPPNTSISSIVKEIMIETWNPSYSYETFFSSCAPNYCTYSELTRSHTMISVCILLFSMLGGLTISVRLISPWIVKFSYKFFEIISRRRQEQQQAPDENRINLRMRDSILSLYELITNLNIFSMRDIGSNVDRATVKYIGKWSTRVYLSLFFLGLSILTLYTFIQPNLSTKIFDKPSFDFYNQLHNEYKDELQCSCATLASKYKDFVEIDVIYHEICTSPWISDQWRINLTSTFLLNISVFDPRDYRRFLSAHLQYLSELCEQSIETVNDSIQQYLGSLFVTTQLISENEFSSRLNSSIEQRKEITPNKLMNLFSLIRSINHRNGFVSMYGTNFQYFSDWFWMTSSVDTYLASQPIMYDNGCSCGLQPNCTTQANFILPNLTQIPLKGLKMGCTPSESLHVSTLECFYDETCLDLLRQYTYSTKPFNPLSIRTSQYLVNTSVSQLIDNLFVEQWITSINYSSYYQQCSPLFCSYTYVQKFSFLYTIALILGLQGGLAIVLKWISPKLVRILILISQQRTRRANVIQPVNSLETINTRPNLNTNPTNFFQRPNRLLIKCLLIGFLVLILIIGLILFSIYAVRQTKNDGVSTSITSSTTLSTTNTTDHHTTTATTTTSIVTTDFSPCQLEFELTGKYQSGSTLGLKSPVVADFNNDNLLDVVFFNYGTQSFHVLIGDGKGNYTAELKTLVGSFTTWAFIIATADFNEDKNLDLIFTSENRNYVYLIFGNGNGTFQSLTTIYMGDGVRTRGIGIFDFNNDTYLDVALASQSENTIFVLMGYGNGSFADQVPYYAGPNTNPSSLALADVNADGYEDIVYNNIMTRTIGVLLGQSDGTFQPQITSFAGGYYNPSFIAIGDFNGDHLPDVAISYSSGNRIGIVLGYGNGSMSAVTKFSVGNKTYYARIAAGDFNNDGFSDVVVGSINPYDIYVLVSSGNGDFDVQHIFSAGFNGLYSWMNVADLNSDGCQDIIASEDTQGTVFFLLNTCACQTNNSTISL